MPRFFKSSRILEEKITEFFSKVQDAALVFRAAVNEYLEGRLDELKKRTETIDAIETSADNLRRQIRTELYAQMLIPESRGDVLGLLESNDDVVDLAERVIYHLDIEQPVIPDALKPEFRALADASASAVEALINADTAYFKEPEMVNTHINKVAFYESEADDKELDLKHKIFNSEIVPGLAERNQLRYFVEEFASLSDAAEQVADRLSVSAIKRSI